MWDIEFDRANILAVWRQVAETTHETYRVFDPDEQIQIPPMDADLFTETSLASSEWVVEADGSVYTEPNWIPLSPLDAPLTMLCVYRSPESRLGLELSKHSGAVYRNIKSAQEGFQGESLGSFRVSFNMDGTRVADRIHVERGEVAPESPLNDVQIDYPKVFFTWPIVARTLRVQFDLISRIFPIVSQHYDDDFLDPDRVLRENPELDS